MKSILTTMSFILLAFTTYSQNTSGEWGNWGIGPFKDQSTLNVYQPYHILGYHIYYNWSDLEPTPGNFTWSRLDSQMQTIAQNNLWIGVQIMVGPNCPLWIYDSVPKVYTTGGNNNGPYPYYLNTYYTARFMNVFKQAANHFRNLPANLKAKFKYWQLCAGSTGDEDPYKGTVTNNAYAIDYYTWEAYREASWDSAGVYAPDRYYRFLINTGNYAQDLDLVHAQFPFAYHKDGELTHDYSFNGESLYFGRQYTEKFNSGDTDRTRSEVQDIFNNSWWKIAPVRQAFELVASSLSGGLDMMNITPGLIGSINNDTRPMQFFQKYAGLKTAKGSNVGFIALRDALDFADSARFPVATYGPLVDPAKLASYNAQIKNINSNTQDSATRKYWLDMETLVNDENPARINMIVNQFKSAGAMYNTTGDEYHNDFGTDLTHNFRRFMIEIGYKEAFDSTSYGAWRIGPDSSIYGRYARLCKLINGKGQMFFAIDSGLINTGAKMYASVTYYDTGNGQWAVNCSNVNIKVSNTGTRKWLTTTVTFTSFKPRTLFSGQADISLQYVSGTNTPFALIEVRQDTTKTSLAAQLQPQKLNITVSPNPNFGQFKISFAAKKEEQYSIFITDVSGNSRFTEIRQSTNGNNQWNISANLGRGSYLLHIESPTEVGTAKFLVVQ